jgi:hypothetical protein
MLYIDLNGRISCKQHIGAEATAVLKRRPEAMSVRTSLTHWQRLPEGYEHLQCEACKYAKRAA